MQAHSPHRTRLCVGGDYLRLRGWLPVDSPRPHVQRNAGAQDSLPTWRQRVRSPVNRSIDRAKRKRARYVAGTIGMVLRQNKNLGPDSPIAFVSTIGQLRFIRAVLNRSSNTGHGRG